MTHPLLSKRQLMWTGSALATAVIFMPACGKKKSSAATDTTTVTTPAATTDTSTSNTATTALNTLAAAIPGNLSLTAFSTSTTSSALALDDDGLLLDDDASANAGSSPADELKEKQKILIGGATDGCLAASFKKPPAPPTSETCYEFDSDMIQTKSTNAGNPNAQTTGTANGKNAKGEACLVGFARSQIVKIKDPLDRAQAVLNAALCQANKDEKAKAKAAGTDPVKVDLIPANVGDSLDLAPALKAAFAEAKRTKEVVTSMSMKRLSDVSGQKVFQSVFKMTDDQGNVRAFTLNHSPKDSSNEEYNGTLYFAVKPPAGKGDPMAGASGDKDVTTYISIAYQRVKAADGSFTMSYEARSGRFIAGVDPISSTGLVDFNVGADFSVATSDPNYGAYKKSDNTYYAMGSGPGNGFNYVTVSNTEDKNGKPTAQTLGFWVNPGSTYKENARGMVFSASANATTGLMEGCANSGSASIDFSSGISIRRALKEGDADANVSLKPRGIFHPFANTEARVEGTTITTNGTPLYKYKKVETARTSEWAPLLVTGTDQVTFVEKAVAAVMTSQCFKQNTTSGLWEIDAAKTAGTDGFDIIGTTSPKLLTPPAPPKPPLQVAGATKIDFKPAGGVASLDD